MHSTDRYEIFKINYRYFCTLVISNFGINLSPIITFKNKRLPQFKWRQHTRYDIHVAYIRLELVSNDSSDNG